MQQATSGSEDRARFRRTAALGREFAFASEVAAAGVYLASEQAAFVTGQVLQIDGGVSLT